MMLRRSVLAAVVLSLLAVLWPAPAHAVEPTAPKFGCTYDASLGWKCIDPSTGQPYNPYAPDNLSIGYAPGAATLPSTFTIGGVQTATSTAAGAAAGAARCGSWCLRLSELVLGGLRLATMDSLLTPTETGISTPAPMVPDPAGYGVLVPCAMPSVPGFQAGVTTGSSLTWRADAIAPGAQSAGRCTASATLTTYSLDGAGLLVKHSGYWSTGGICGPGCTVSTDPAFATKVGGIAPSTNIVVYASLTPIPYSTGKAGFPDFMDIGAIPEAVVQYQTQLRCEFSGGGWKVETRSDIARIVAPFCSQPTTGTDFYVGTQLTIYSRGLVNDGWSMIDQYDLAKAPDPVEQDQHAACYIASGSNFMNVCGWAVLIDDIPCLPGASESCFNWTTTRASEPQRVKCMMGPYVMPAEQCNWLERQYKGVQYPATKPNVDGDPATWDGPEPQWQPQPQPSATPTVTTTVTVSESPTATSSPTATATATATPTSTVTAQPTSTGVPTSTPTSTSGTGTDTGTAPGQAGSPAPADSPGNACWPSGWGILNPAEWVLRPLHCAFVPSVDAAATRQANLTARLSEAGPAPLINAIGSNFAALGSAGGCAGPSMPFNLSGVSEDIRPFNACTAPMSTVAGYSHALSSVVLIVGGGLACARAISSAFGLSFSMGRNDSE